MWRATVALVCVNTSYSYVSYLFKWNITSARAKIIMKNRLLYLLGEGQASVWEKWWKCEFIRHDGWTCGTCGVDFVDSLTRFPWWWSVIQLFYINWPRKISVAGVNRHTVIYWCLGPWYPSVAEELAYISPVFSKSFHRKSSLTSVSWEAIISSSYTGL